MNIFEIAELLGKHNLGLEIHLNDFDAEIGNPYPLVQGGVWPRSFGKEEHKRLISYSYTFIKSTSDQVSRNYELSSDLATVTYNGFRAKVRWQFQEALG